MNANVRHHGWNLQPARLEPPEAAWARLRSHLGQPGNDQQVWDASFCYGISYAELAELVDYWRDELELPRRLLDLSGFDAAVFGEHLRLVFVKAARPGKLPLLLLHGYTGSLLELGTVARALVDAGSDVVAPALPGFGSSFRSPSAFAGACAALMQSLGYSRYAVHGSDLGASIALELAAADPAHVAALHVSQVPAYPGESPEDSAALTAAEKSKLARLTELHEQLQFQLPQTPIEELAFALSRLDGADLGSARLRDDLLTSLTLTHAFGSSARRADLYRTRGLAPAPPSDVPLFVDERPLGVPSLRRLAERRHRVVDWCERETGGPSPGIEDPEGLAHVLERFRDGLR